ncbi:type II secretion system GspH family protein [Candidatus Gracilibacteria bacterium]|nr:type II secretion system GspH family protein [Candidatus Gracilibacteria bacterium]
MNKINKSGFSLIELLVVITILAIISVVAYTNFSGSTGKAKNSKKLNDITSIETGLQTFYQDKNYYPMPSAYVVGTNVWGYDTTKFAQINNTLAITGGAGNPITAVDGLGGGKVNNTAGTQIGSKGVIDSSVLSKQYLSQELVDPSLKDIKVGDTQSFKDFGIGKYVYGVYAKSDFSTSSRKGQAYNIAVTLTDEQKGYLAKIVGNFDNNTCSNCPKSLIGSGTTNNNLMDGESSLTGSVTDINDRIPYPVEGF